jgi:uncharacterized membrane protein YfcA
MNLFDDVSLLIAAFTASLFGQGGGVLYTPLQIWSGINFTTAAATSLFLILVTSISATIVFRKAHKVDWGIAMGMEIPTTVGAFLGGIVSHYVSALFLGLLLSALLAVAAWFMLHPIKATDPVSHSDSSSRWTWQRIWNGQKYQIDLRLMVPCMLVIGILTSMVGIGGGALKVPLMVLLFHIPIPSAIGSSAFMVGLTATAGLLGHISVGHFNWMTALLLAVPVFIGGQIGSRLSIRLNARKLSKWFGVFIVLVACISAIHAIKVL